jgi:hypothetical protein
MTSNNVCKLLLVLLIAAGTTKSTTAADVFTWQDVDGVTHFSQWAPDDVRNVSRLVVNANNPPGYDPLEDPYSIRNQAERTNETWKELAARKEERREKLRKEQERNARNSPPPYDYYSYRQPRYYWPVHRPIYPPVRPPIRPPGHKPTPLPVHPIARPGFSPDPMRSAHIGVRRNPPPNAPARIE